MGTVIPDLSFALSFVRKNERGKAYWRSGVYTCRIAEGLEHSIVSPRTERQKAWALESCPIASVQSRISTCSMQILRVLHRSETRPMRNRWNESCTTVTSHAEERQAEESPG